MPGDEKEHLKECEETNKKLLTEIEKLKEENKRYRTALEFIAMPLSGYGSITNSYKAVKTAKQALQME